MLGAGRAPLSVRPLSAAVSRSFAHCLVRALAHNEGGPEALLQKFGNDVPDTSKWAAVRAAAKATPLASRVAGFIVQWAIAMRIDAKDGYSITEYQRFWSENERKAYRLQAEFASCGPEFDTPNELAAQIVKYVDGSIPARLSKNRKPHQVFLTAMEAALFREQLLARARSASLVFPTPTGKQRTESGFRERVWSRQSRRPWRTIRLASGRSSRASTSPCFGAQRVR